MTHPAFEIVQTTMGVTSIRDLQTGEIMHNPVGPWVEANALYVEQSRLAARLSVPSDRDLVVFDVGLGAGANALATLSCARETRPGRPLRLISFERDVSLLRFALDHAEAFPHFTGFEEAIRALLDHGRWEESGIVWELRHGDFPALVDAETYKANLIFYDPYSPKKNVDMWTIETFRKIYAACAPEDALLLTYSRSTSVRVALLVAGFAVGVGSSSGLKDETTQAAIWPRDLSHALTSAWLARWERSHTQNAPGSKAGDLDQVRHLVRGHHQFA